MPAPKRVTFTEHEDNMIRRAYSVGCYGTGDKGPIATAARLGKSTSSVHRRAAHLGVLRTGHRQARYWTPAEEQVLEANAHKELDSINRALIKAGYESRSLESIKGKLRQLGLKLRETRADNGLYTQYQLAELMGINQNVISRYIRDGHLKAKRRENIKQIEYSIKAADVRALIKDYAPMIDLAKCDKYWLIDLLTGAIK